MFPRVLGYKRGRDITHGDILEVSVHLRSGMCVTWQLIK
jgi:hypothetical protein